MASLWLRTSEHSLHCLASRDRSNTGRTTWRRMVNRLAQHGARVWTVGDGQTAVSREVPVQRQNLAQVLMKCDLLAFDATFDPVK